MNLPHMVQVVRVGSGAEDPFGNPTTGETSRSAQQARLWQLGSTEVTVGRDTAADQWRGILNPGVGIDAGDRVEWDGRVFNVDGTPDKVYAASTVHHVEVALRYAGPVT